MVSPCNCPGQYWKGSDERTFPSVSHLQVGEGCSVAVRKIYLYIVCGTPIPPPSLICRGENVGTYTISTREHPWWYSTVLARRIRPHPPFFATWARFFTKRFTTPVLVAMRLTLDTGSTFFEFSQIELCQIAENGIQDLDKNIAHLDGLCVDCSVIVYCRAQIDNQMFIWSFQNVSK